MKFGKDGKLTYKWIINRSEELGSWTLEYNVLFTSFDKNGVTETTGYEITFVNTNKFIFTTQQGVSYEAIKK